MRLLSNWLENSLLLTDHYLQIPHAFSAVWIDGEEIKIDTERSFDDQDPYIGEEAMLAPPECATDRFWRRNTTRLTYLVCQFFYGLLSGDFPPHGEAFIKAGTLLSRHSPEEISALHQFLNKGLSPLPENRYQNFQELIESLQWLEYKLSLISSGIPSSATSRHLPKMPQAFYKNVVTTRVTPAADDSAASQIKYEVQLWNPSYKNAAKMVVQTPARVVVGRKESKVVDANQERDAVNSVVADTTRIEQTLEEKDGMHCYTVLVEGDRCLSRRHAELQLPANLMETPRFKDLGSTHGVLLFRDRSRSVSNSVFVGSGAQSNFVCVEDQHLKLGNTYIRIRSIKAGME